jgi:hypothetical protein
MMFAIESTTEKVNNYHSEKNEGNNNCVKLVIITKIPRAFELLEL